MWMLISVDNVFKKLINCGVMVLMVNSMMCDGNLVFSLLGDVFRFFINCLYKCVGYNGVFVINVCYR